MSPTLRIDDAARRVFTNAIVVQPEWLTMNGIDKPAAALAARRRCCQARQRIIHESKNSKRRKSMITTLRPPVAKLTERAGTLTFAPLAWLKIQFYCHAGPTEIGGFGISSSTDLLRIEEFITVPQEASPVTVRFRDEGVADFYDRNIDAGLDLQRFSRVWIHTHPGASAQPSGTDEETFSRCFGRSDWSVMAIVSRMALSYARLAFSVGPGGQVLLPVAVDWAAWPACLETSSFDALIKEWQQEYAANVKVMLTPATTLVPRPAKAEGEAPTTIDRFENFDLHHILSFFEEPYHDF